MKLIILVQRHECLYVYNLQHKDYYTSLVKDTCWKEIAGELHCTVGEWPVSGRRTAWDRHGMCELAFNVAGERHGNGMVCVNPPLDDHLFTSVSVVQIGQQALHLD
jgi:hypothetical protein